MTKKILEAAPKNPLSKKTDILLNNARKIAEEFVALTRDFYERVEIAGSIRRKKPVVHDIDICAIAKKPVPEFTELVEKIGGKMIHFGGEYATLLFRGAQVNVLFVTPETWGAGLMWSTGPKGHTIGMNIKADQLGYRFARTGIRKRSDDTLIPTPTEEDIATLLHWAYKIPEKRGEKAERPMY